MLSAAAPMWGQAGWYRSVWKLYSSWHPGGPALYWWEWILLPLQRSWAYLLNSLPAAISHVHDSTCCLFTLPANRQGGVVTLSAGLPAMRSAFFKKNIYQNFSPVANEFRSWLETSCTFLPPWARELECHEGWQQEPEPICGTSLPLSFSCFFFSQLHSGDVLFWSGASLARPL